MKLHKQPAITLTVDEVAFSGAKYPCLDQNASTINVGVIISPILEQVVLSKLSLTPAHAAALRFRCALSFEVPADKSSARQIRELRIAYRKHLHELSDDLPVVCICIGEDSVYECTLLPDFDAAGQIVTLSLQFNACHTKKLIPLPDLKNENAALSFCQFIPVAISAIAYWTDSMREPNSISDGFFEPLTSSDTLTGDYFRRLIEEFPNVLEEDEANEISSLCWEVAAQARAAFRHLAVLAGRAELAEEFSMPY